VSPNSSSAFDSTQTGELKIIGHYGHLEPNIMEEIWDLYQQIFQPSEIDFYRRVERYKLHAHHLYSSIALYDGKVVGFKLGYPEDNMMFYSWLGCVNPSFRKLGLGSKFMDIQHEYCRNNEFLWVYTTTRNKWKGMIDLNFRFGFQIIGTTIDENGETRLHLRKTL
jgi:GNAT superfamily N-acetyltransferase